MASNDEILKASRVLQRRYDERRRVDARWQQWLHHVLMQAFGVEPDLVNVQARELDGSHTELLATVYLDDLLDKDAIGRADSFQQFIATGGGAYDCRNHRYKWRGSFDVTRPMKLRTPNFRTKLANRGLNLDGLGDPSSCSCRYEKTTLVIFGIMAAVNLTGLALNIWRSR